MLAVIGIIVVLMLVAVVKLMCDIHLVVVIGIMAMIMDYLKATRKYAISVQPI